MTVNVGNWAVATVAMGPGKRFCLWVRGCSIDCRGCITQELIPREPRNTVAVDAIWRQIQDALRDHGIEGVSFSGGEPFEQAVALAEIAAMSRSVGLSTLSWSGYTRKFLESTAAPDGARALLANLDVLIDGPFMEKRAGKPLPLRGSSNQTIHLLTDRYEKEDFKVACFEAIYTPDGLLRGNGVIDYVALEAVLQAFGIVPTKD